MNWRYCSSVIGAMMMAPIAPASANDPEVLSKLRALDTTMVTDRLSLVQMFPPGKHDFSSPFADGHIAVEPARAIADNRFARVPMMIGATSLDIGGPSGMMITGATGLADQLSGNGVPVYLYRFSYAAQSLHMTGANHASDIPFFFATQDIKYGDQTTARDNAMGATISDYLVNFARTGDPNGGALPAWPRHTAGNGRRMDFGLARTADFKIDPALP